MARLLAGDWIYGGNNGCVMSLGLLNGVFIRQEVSDALKTKAETRKKHSTAEC